MQLLDSDRPRPRLTRPGQGRVGTPPLLGYVGGAGALALAVTAALMAIDAAGRDQAVRIEDRPSPVATPQPVQAAMGLAPAPTATFPAPTPPPAGLAAPAQPAPAALAPAREAASERLPRSAAGSSADRLASPTAAAGGAEPVETAAIPLPSAGPEPVRTAPQAGSERGSLTESAAAPLQCLSDEARAVLTGLAKAVGGVEILSTTELHTDNHSPGSARAELHKACKAVDLKVRGRTADATAFLRGRGEVASIQPYRNGVIHIDFHDGGRTASASGSRPSRRIRAARSPEPAPVEAAPAPAPAPPSPFEAAPRPDIAR